jgi:Tfp pilus assembly protein PilX
MMKKQKFNKGFTLLLALIVANAVLIMGLGVYGIIIREIELSGLGRESQIAFYAADSGTECALYWDIKKGAISTTTPVQIECGSQFISAGGSLRSSFNLNFDNGACARIIIDKSNPPRTQIDSYGYNFNCDAIRPRKVERGIRITY